jgi:uncharacterized RDD family membrane protein YckC
MNLRTRCVLARRFGRLIITWASDAVSQRYSSCLSFYMREKLRFAQSQAPNYWRLMLLGLYEPLLTRYLCTPGQLLMSIRVRTEPGIERVPVLRTVVRLVVKYLLGFISFVFMPAHREKRALHDLAAGAIVADARSLTLRGRTAA